MTDTKVYDFSDALEWLRGGYKVSRRGWNGKGMFIYLVFAEETEVGVYQDTQMLHSILGEGFKIKRQARIDMKFANGEIGIWTPTHEDILAKDWNILR